MWAKLVSSNNLIFTGSVNESLYAPDSPGGTVSWKAPEVCPVIFTVPGLLLVNVDEGMELLVDKSGKTKVGSFISERLSELTSLDSTVLYIPSLSMSTSILS